MANGGIIGPPNAVSQAYDKDKVTSFTSSGCFNKSTTNPAAPGNATVVVVAGAGGSGSDAGGAGGGQRRWLVVALVHSVCATTTCDHHAHTCAHPALPVFHELAEHVRRCVQVRWRRTTVRSGQRRSERAAQVKEHFGQRVTCVLHGRWRRTRCGRRRIRRWLHWFDG